MITIMSVTVNVKHHDGGLVSMWNWTSWADSIRCVTMTKCVSHFHCAISIQELKTIIIIITHRNDFDYKISVWHFVLITFSTNICHLSRFVQSLCNSYTTKPQFQRDFAVNSKPTHFQRQPFSFEFAWILYYTTNWIEFCFFRHLNIRMVTL